MDSSDSLLKAQPAVALDQLKGLCDIVLCSYEKSEGLTHTYYLHTCYKKLSYMTKTWEKLIKPSTLSECPSPSSKFEISVPGTNSRIYSVD